MLSTMHAPYSLGPAATTVHSWAQTRVCQDLYTCDTNSATCYGSQSHGCAHAHDHPSLPIPTLNPATLLFDACFRDFLASQLQGLLQLTVHSAEGLAAVNVSTAGGCN
jgi:hypothetical protein